jgi:hypothetical protein
MLSLGPFLTRRYYFQDNVHIYLSGTRTVGKCIEKLLLSYRHLNMRHLYPKHLILYAKTPDQIDALKTQATPLKMIEGPLKEITRRKGRLRKF